MSGVKEIDISHGESSASLKTIAIGGSNDETVPSKSSTSESPITKINLDRTPSAVTSDAADVKKGSGGTAPVDDLDLLVDPSKVKSESLSEPPRVSATGGQESQEGSGTLPGVQISRTTDTSSHGAPVETFLTETTDLSDILDNKVAMDDNLMPTFNVTTNSEVSPTFTPSEPRTTTPAHRLSSGNASSAVKAATAAASGAAQTPPSTNANENSAGEETGEGGFFSNWFGAKKKTDDSDANAQAAPKDETCV